MTHNLSLDDVAGTEALAHLDAVHVVHAHVLRSVVHSTCACVVISDNSSNSNSGGKQKGQTG